MTGAADSDAEPLYYPLEALPSGDSTRRHAVAVGVFDGVHHGHQALLAACVRASQEATAESVMPAALTFDPHPATVFAPSRVPMLLGTVAERAALLRAYGASSVIVAGFDRVLAARTPDEFVQDVLVERLRAHTVVVGEDFRYGRNRAGDVAALRRAGERWGFAVCIVPPVIIDGIPARSTNIRKLLSHGQVEESNGLLGYSYTLWGTVARGRQLGRTLGYPTANLASTPGILVPGAGVYAGWVRLGDELFRAAISVGDNPTIAPGLPRTVEAFLLDGFSRDIYGARIGVAFAAFMRPMERFDGLDALVAQMARDVEEAERRLG
jgi:riboflavin kinase/FMN adenylyltransferase